jgi:hypothetical protein
MISAREIVGHFSDRLAEEGAAVAAPVADTTGTHTFSSLPACLSTLLRTVGTITFCHCSTCSLLTTKSRAESVCLTPRQESNDTVCRRQTFRGDHSWPDGTLLGHARASQPPAPTAPTQDALWASGSAPPLRLPRSTGQASTTAGPAQRLTLNWPIFSVL